MQGRWTTEGQTTITEVLAAAVQRWPDKTYLNFSGDKYTFAETQREADRIAAGLHALGVKKGDRVCALVGNCADYVFLWFGVCRLGAVFVPINTDMRGEFLRYLLADTGAKIIVADAEYVERVLAVEDGVAELETLVVKGEKPSQRSRLSIMGLDSLRKKGEEPPQNEIRPSDLAMLIYTSGTTGPSKGCMISHNYACNFGRQQVWAVDLTQEDVHFTPCPLFHSAAAFGVVISSLLVGATVAVAPRFSASNFWSQIEESGATAALLLSVMLSIIPNAEPSEAAKRCYGQLRLVYGTPLTRDLIQKWKEKFGIPHVSSIAYGLTEACMLTLVKANHPDIPEGSSGRRHADFDVRVVDDQGNECLPGTPGEVVVRPRKPDIMFKGYWNKPEATAEAWQNLWFRTGDFGKFDEQGFFYFVDRKKDYLRRGGENISSFEVERVFLMHPMIADVAAHAVKSELAEDDLKVTAVLKEGAQLTEEELWGWASEQLPRFAVPRFIEFRTELPRTATGRLQKFKLREEGVTPSTWSAAPVSPRKPKAGGVRPAAAVSSTS